MPWLKQHELPWEPEAQSETSKQAAAAMLETADTLRAKVYRMIARANRLGATDDEIEVALGLRHQTASARRRELVLAGHVTDSGQRRATRSGRMAVVWVVGKQ